MNDNEFRELIEKTIKNLLELQKYAHKNIWFFYGGIFQACIVSLRSLVLGEEK